MRCIEPAKMGHSASARRRTLRSPARGLGQQKSGRGHEPTRPGTGAGTIQSDTTTRPPWSAAGDGDLLARILAMLLAGVRFQGSGCGQIWTGSVAAKNSVRVEWRPLGFGLWSIGLVRCEATGILLGCNFCCRGPPSLRFRTTNRMLVRWRLVSASWRSNGRRFETQAVRGLRATRTAEFNRYIYQYRIMEHSQIA
jgi:hypothetical protein